MYVTISSPPVNQGEVLTSHSLYSTSVTDSVGFKLFGAINFQTFVIINVNLLPGHTLQLCQHLLPQGESLNPPTLIELHHSMIM